MNYTNENVDYVLLVCEYFVYCHNKLIKSNMRIVVASSVKVKIFLIFQRYYLIVLVHIGRLYTYAD